MLHSPRRTEGLSIVSSFISMNIFSFSFFSFSLRNSVKGLNVVKLLYCMPYMHELLCEFMVYNLCLSIFFLSSVGLIPPAVLARGSKAKAAYRRALKNGKTCDVRVRIMLIGQDHAGKTSVKRSLKGEKFNKREPSTQGVQMDAPLLKAGIKAWKTHQADEATTVFDHKSAQLVARQLSGTSDEPAESATQSSSPGLPWEWPTRKDPLSNGVKCSEDPFVFKELPSATNIVSNGVGTYVDLPSQRIEGKYNITNLGPSLSPIGP